MRRYLIALLTPLLLVLALPAPAAAAPNFRALLFTETAGYVHDSISAGVTMINNMAAANNFEVVQSNNSSSFTTSNLATFDVVIMLQNSGMVWDNDSQRQALQAYVEGGGGIVAIHNATDMGIESTFPYWDNLIQAGAHMPAHSNIVQGTAKVADDVHPSTSGLPDRWTRTEEWYNFDRSIRGDAHILVTADETTYSPGGNAMGHDHPISWCREVGTAKVWATAMGHTASTYSEAYFQQHVLGGIRWAGGELAGDCGGTVWNRFQKVTLDSAPNQPMQLDIAPDKTVFYASRAGQLKTINPSNGQIATAHTLSVYTGGEDGLVGLALDPNFASNRYIYLYYSPTGSQSIVRVSRFTYTAANAPNALSNEQILLTIPAERIDEPGHTGGYLTFGPNGNLYIGVGDDVNPNASSGYAPIDERSGRAHFDAQRTAANTNDLRGKILRIHPESNGTYTIPSGNMFAQGTANTRPEIYAMGFRNPFRFAVNKENGWISMADYGPDAGSANSSRGPAGIVEYNLIKSPGFYGWPYCTGNNTPYNDFNFATNQSGALFNCSNPTNTSPNNTGLQTLPAARAANVWYSYSGNTAWPEMGNSGGAAPMGGPFYHFDPNLVSDTKFPQYFDDTPFFYEWSRNFLAEMRLDNSGNLLKVNRFLSSMQFRSPMDMKFGPDGSLYMIDWGSGFGGTNTDDGVYRIDYINGSRAPQARASGTPTSGQAPLTVQFSSSGSADPDGDAITYAWDFTDNGSVDSTSANPSFTYSSNGNYTARLTVRDAGGKTGTATVPIVVGNTAPTLQFSAPPNGGAFDFGDTISYTITGSDAEDGAIDCSRVQVIIALGHDTHSHDVDQRTGCSATITTQQSGHDATQNVFYVLSATYTDSGGLSKGAELILQPKMKQAEHFASSSGVRVVADTTAQDGNRVGDISNNDWISFAPMATQGVTGISYRVSSISTGGSIELRAGSPTGTLLSTTSVPSTGGWTTYASTAVSSVTGVSGSQTFYLVFKHSTANQFDLDSFTLQGQGVGGTPTTTGPVAGGIYQIVNVGSSKAVDIEGASTADGARVVQWSPGSGTNQRFRFVDAGSGAFRLQPTHSNKCIDVSGASTATGALLVQWTCHTNANQSYRFTAQGSNWRIQAGHSNLCLEVPNSTDLTQLRQNTCSTATSQQWRLTRIS
ncbi:ThuA domain-containing protein [Herbidospora cretacea]|uniref:ThuA domain-containing protein n=1 Tax=Herbidospora cretacea TaxID=28444 RepID=UPI000774AFDD|nr:ThuA domain-containing protein [Herbidospora cretacea]